MKRTLAVALAALAAACGGSGTKEQPIQYGPPQAPTPTQKTAAADAAATLQANLAYQASTEPTAGAAGLGDQLASSLGGSTLSAKMTNPSSAKLAAPVLRQAFDTSTMDPACVTSSQAGGATTWTWGAATPCHVVVSSSDPTSGDVMTMTVDVTGTLTWDPGLGKTSWHIGEGFALDVTSGGQRVTTDGTATLVGSLQADASTIQETDTSTIAMTTHYAGLTIPEALETTLVANLGYQANCITTITTGSITVEQHWLTRPMGATAQDYPNQGWILTWHGCGAFDVQLGS